jgi:hypothetical protein
MSIILFPNLMFWFFDDFMYQLLFWYVTVLVDILVVDHLSYYQKYTICHIILEWSLVKNSVQISMALNSWMVLHFWGFKFKLLDTVAPSNGHDLQLWPTFLTQIIGWHQIKSAIMSSKFWWSKSTVLKFKIKLVFALLKLTSIILLWWKRIS